MVLYSQIMFKIGNRTMQEFTSIRIRIEVELHDFLKRTAVEQKTNMTAMIVEMIKKFKEKHQKSIDRK